MIGTLNLLSYEPRLVFYLLRQNHKMTMMEVIRHLPEDLRNNNTHTSIVLRSVGTFSSSIELNK